MAYQSLNQIKSAVQHLSPRERIALREYLEEFKDFEEAGKVIKEFRAAAPTSDWEEIVANVSSAVAESRDAQAHRRVRYQRLHQRSDRKTRSARARA
jgi:hypothetical protein